MWVCAVMPVMVFSCTRLDAGARICAADAAARAAAAVERAQAARRVLEDERRCVDVMWWSSVLVAYDVIELYLRRCDV
jgi:hypothetical protein